MTASRTLQILATAGLLALLAAVLASVQVQAASPSTITGVVTVLGSSTPIAGAQVTTQPASSSAITDSGGNYTLNLTAGTYNVIFTAGGYNTDFIAGVVAPANGTVAANAALVPVPANAAEDLFSRPDQSILGTASDGHTWSNDLNVYPNGTASIVGRQAFIQCFTANTDHDTWMGIAYRDQEITADLNFVHFGGRLLARVTGSDAWIVLALNSSSRTLTIWVDNHGNWAQIGSVAHGFSLNTWYHAKLDVIGAGVYGKAWAFGTTEPAFQVSATQSALMSAGVGGLRCAIDDVHVANFLETPITQISGKVTEAGTGALLTGATVTLSNGASTTTDIEAKYVFAGLASGTYTVTASASGHSPASVNATVSTGLGALQTNLVLTATSTTLSASPSTVGPGGSVTATWSGVASPTSGDWIGLYAAGAPDNSALSFRYTGGTASGSLSYNVGAVSPGTYELRLFANNSLSRLATSGAITVQAASLSASPSTVGPGGSVTATWSGIASPTTGDWIGLYAAGAPDSSALSFRYTGGAASGSLSYNVGGVSPGTYELRLFANNSLSRLATSGAIAVQAASLSASPSTINPGGSVTATWSGVASPTSGDWIGLYAAGAPDSSALSFRYTGGAASGSLSYNVGGVSPGTYELRLFANNSLSRLATSGAITVQGASLSASPTTVSPGGSVTASWSGVVSPTANDWIGLYAAGAPDNSPISWRYTTGTGSGSVVFNIPSSASPGTYELRLFANSSLSRLATSGAITIQ